MALEALGQGRLRLVCAVAAGSSSCRDVPGGPRGITGGTALDWGVVNEVVPHERAVERGLEIARGLAAKPALYRSLQKQTLNRNLRKRIVQDVPFGMALEGLTAADQPYQA